MESKGSSYNQQIQITKICSINWNHVKHESSLKMGSFAVRKMARSTIVMMSRDCRAAPRPIGHAWPNRNTNFLKFWSIIWNKVQNQGAESMFRGSVQSLCSCRGRLSFFCIELMYIEFKFTNINKMGVWVWGWAGEKFFGKKIESSAREGQSLFALKKTKNFFEKNYF